MVDQVVGTSKFPLRPDAHGRHGIFLAAVAALSLVSITSHHRGYHSHNSLIIHNSSVLARHVPSPPEHRLLAFTHGTRVTVRDLFGSMPVRVKQRAVDAERGVHSKDWENLKRALVSLLLSWPHQVSIHLRDSRSQHSISTRCVEPVANRHAKGEANAAVYRVSSILQQAQLSNDAASESWVPLRASVGSMSVIGATSLVPVATRRVQFISIGIRPLSNEHGSNILFEEINKMFSNSSFGVEEDCSDIDEEEQKRRAADRRYKTDGYTGRELKARKGIDRWPMFYIKLDLEGKDAPSADPDVDEVLDERHGNLKAIIELLRAVFYEFLKRYHFRPRHFKPSKSLTLNQDVSKRSVSRTSTPGSDSRNSPSLPPHSKTPPGELATTRLNLKHLAQTSSSRSRPDSPFDSWTRVKSGRPHSLSLRRKAPAMPGDGNFISDLPDNEPPQEGPPDHSFVTLDNEDQDNSPSTPILDANTFQSIQEAEGETHTTREVKDSMDEGIVWTNPVTKERSVVDSRTGFIIQPSHKKNKHPGKEEEGRSTKKLRLQPGPTATGERSPWLNEVLASWENPVFQHTEPPIPMAFDESKAFGSTSCHENSNSRLITTEPSDSMQGKISKEALRQAEFIAQVDRKFILAKVSMARPRNGEATIEGLNTSLIIVDQHAADERCRVETLLKEYFEVVERSGLAGAENPVLTQLGTTVRACTEVLEKPLKFEVSTTDALQLVRSANYFRKWGIWYEISAPQATTTKKRGGKPPSQLKVQKLPPSIAERCRTEPRILIDLLRKEAWKVDEHDHRVPGSDTGPLDSTIGVVETESRWLSRLHGCPRGILDMINSRACRSAVMFNDELLPTECVSLLARLADCAFPFQCAHGRPSMVPLLDLGRAAVGHLEGTAGKSDATTAHGLSFGRDFKRWKAGLLTGVENKPFPGG